MTRAPLAGLRIAVDVQHLYRRSHAGDRGAVFTLPNGTHVTEAHAATQYAGALASELRAGGADVLTNDATAGVLVGDYWTRNRQAAAWRAHAYLACHVNAGGGRYARTCRMAGEYVPGAAFVDAFDLSAAILRALAAGLVEISSGSATVLRRGERGAVCIQSFNGPGLVLEPFFGDSLAHQGLLVAPGVQAVGMAIAAGVESWWVARKWPPSAGRQSW